MTSKYQVGQYIMVSYFSKHIKFENYGKITKVDLGKRNISYVCPFTKVPYNAMLNCVHYLIMPSSYNELKENYLSDIKQDVNDIERDINALTLKLKEKERLLMCKMLNSFIEEE